MAIATLEEVQPPASAAESERRFILRTDLENGDYDGPSGTSWAHFEVLGDFDASYEWKTRADVVRDLARAVFDEKTTFDEACRDEIFANYMSAQIAWWIDAAEPDEPVEDEQTIALKICREIVDYVTDPGSLGEPWSANDIQDHVYLADAARALGPLPSWARVEFVDAGGPGFGFSQPVLILGEGKGLDDLAHHLRLIEGSSCSD